MLGIIYSSSDAASENMGRHMVESHVAESVRTAEKYTVYQGKDISICRIGSPLTNADFIDSMGFSTAVFLSKHQSSAGIASFTTHPMGNWGSSADLGGRPKSLSVAAPVLMLRVLGAINAVPSETVKKTYEVTHHGPLLDTPSLFVELGGNASVIKNAGLARKLSDAVYGSLANGSSEACDKVVIGIGSRHYPSKFTALALGKGYAFSHMLPSHMIYNKDGSDNLDMLKHAAERSELHADCAVIEWKGLRSSEREKVIHKLNEIGMDYERV